MIISIKTNSSSGVLTDVGEHNLANNTFTLWFNASRLDSNLDELSLPNVDIPKDIKEVNVVDHGSGIRLKLPISFFKKAYSKVLDAHVFKYSDLLNKYRNLD